MLLHVLNQKSPELQRLAKSCRMTSCCNVQRQMAQVDRCKCEGITKGFAKITVLKNSGGKILGATVVGPNAGSMISELSICIQVTKNTLLFKMLPVSPLYDTLNETLETVQL